MSSSVRSRAVEAARPGGADRVPPVREGSPSAVTGRHLPALDGLRAVAVGGVLAYHLGGLSGGYLGVDLFFVLSGFLITTLLAEEWLATGTVRLASFWARRARRLLPALFALLAALGVVVVVLGRLGAPGAIAHVDLAGLRGDALATLLYVANWHAVVAHQSYFAQFEAPSPLLHTWSLAIEEQFYLLWPPILLLVLARWRHRGSTVAGWRWAVAALALAAAVGSAALMALLYHRGGDPTRVYFGTDTRLFDLLAGVLVAMVAAGRRQPSPRARAALHGVAPLAAGGLAWFWVTAGTSGGLPTGGMFRGGFVLCAVLAAVVVADVRQLRPGPLGSVLAAPPLRWLGTISYGLYLWHWPVFVYCTAARTGLTGAALDGARVGLTLAVATASYFVVERPLRRRRLSGWPRFALAPLAAAGTAAVVVVATLPAVAVPPAPAVASASRVAGSGRVPGAGGYGAQVPIALPAFGPSDPLRVTVVGDSVARVAEPAIAAALGATGEVTVTDGAIDGFGLNVDPSWRTDLPSLVRTDRTQLVLATWSWDDSCTPAAPPTVGHYATYTCALQHPRAYAAMLEAAVRAMLGPGGAAGVVFLGFPPSRPGGAGGPALADVPAAGAGRDAATRAATRAAAATAAAAAEAAWRRTVRSLPASFPGRVMYLPVARSLLLHGRFTPWLPPADRPGAPRSRWVRVRTVDGVHLCPAGAARYADAVLADLTGLYRLRRAGPGWSTGAWTRDHRYRTPPGSCPADHPPG